MKRKLSRSMSHSLFRINTSNRGLICHTVTVHQFFLLPTLVLPLSRAVRCVCLFAPSLFHLSIFCLLMIVQVYTSMITKHCPVTQCWTNVCLCNICVVFRTVLSFPLSIAQILRMKIFDGCTENHLQRCNMVIAWFSHRIPLLTFRPCLSIERS